MDVTDAGAPAGDRGDRVSAREPEVSGVEEEACLRSGAREEAVDLVLELNDRSHVVVVGEGRAARFVDPRRELVHAPAVVRHLVIRQGRSTGERNTALSLNGVRGLAVDEGEGVELAEERDLGFGPLLLLFNGVHEELARVPARHERETVPLEDRAELRCAQGVLAARLRPGIARLRHLRKARLERSVAAELGKVVVRPRDGGDAESYLLHGSRLLEGPRSLQMSQVYKPVSGTKRTRLLPREMLAFLLVRRARASNRDRWLRTCLVGPRRSLARLRFAGGSAPPRAPPALRGPLRGHSLRAPRGPTTRPRASKRSRPSRGR